MEHTELLRTAAATATAPADRSANRAFGWTCVARWLLDDIDITYYNIDVYQLRFLPFSIYLLFFFFAVASLHSLLHTFRFVFFLQTKTKVHYVVSGGGILTHPVLCAKNVRRENDGV